jgi:uncharacterized protein YegL
VAAPSIPAFSFSVAELQENSEPRLPCVLLVDTSKSMAGERIAALNTGLEVYRTELNADDLAAQRVEVAVASFDSTVEILCPFVGAERFAPPRLQAKGKTAMGLGLETAMQMIEARKKQYRAHGIHAFRPWLFLPTDGTPTDDWLSAARRLRAAEAEGALFFYAIGVEDANFDVLRELTSKPVYRLEGLRFRDLFRWLSQSQRSVSRSSPGRGEAGPPDLLGPWAVRS